MGVVSKDEEPNELLFLAATPPLAFGDAIYCVETALQKEGFGIIGRIDIQNALKTKINLECLSLRHSFDVVPCRRLTPSPLGGRAANDPSGRP